MAEQGPQFKDVRRIYGPNDHSHTRQVDYSHEATARSGLAGTYIDRVFDEVKFIIANPGIADPVRAITSVLDSSWNSVEGLEKFSRSQLGLPAIIREADQSRVSADIGNVTRRSSRLAFARDLLPVVSDTVLRLPQAGHIVVAQSELGDDLTAQIGAAIEEIRGNGPREDSGNRPRFIRKVLGRHGLREQVVAELGCAEAEPHWVEESMASGEEAQVFDVAQAIQNCRQIARGHQRGVAYVSRTKVSS